MAFAGMETKEDPGRLEVPNARRLDPLVLLKNCIISGTKVKFDLDNLHFGDYRVHRNTRCAFRASPDEPFMDIGSIWYMYHEISREEGSYTPQGAKRRGFQYLNVCDRSDLLAYLEGVIDSSEKIVSEVARGLKRPKTESSGVTPAPPRKRHELTERSPQPEAKRRREERFDMSAAEYNLEARPVKDMDGMVRGGKELPSISAILKIAQGELEKWSEVLEIPRESKPQRRVRPFMWELEKLLEQNKEANPIILVPMNKNAPVNMLNVFDLLQEGRYRRPEQQGATGFGYFEALRKDHVKLVRHIDGRRWTFEVRDSTKGFSSKDWLRVVAVITNGDDWQFKGWPFKTVVSMFMTLKGFYFRERDRFVELPEHVSRW
ncbi:unnamed protein product, partial [Effrenium voratum]